MTTRQKFRGKIIEGILHPTAQRIDSNFRIEAWPLVRKPVERIRIYRHESWIRPNVLKSKI